MTHLLDSSAWLAHLFGESGVEEVNRLFDDPESKLSISALSIPEVFARLKSMGREEHWSDVWDIYSQLFSSVIPVGEMIAHQAVQLRVATPERLPTIDGLIAATALVDRLILVHRDPHMAAIPEPNLHQLQLAEE
jgi:predicted nucleic acid-binding protein